MRGYTLCRFHSITGWWTTSGAGRNAWGVTVVCCFVCRNPELFTSEAMQHKIKNCYAHNFCLHIFLTYMSHRWVDHWIIDKKTYQITNMQVHRYACVCHWVIEWSWNFHLVISILLTALTHFIISKPTKVCNYNFFNPNGKCCILYPQNTYASNSMEQTTCSWELLR